MRIRAAGVGADGGIAHAARHGRGRAAAGAAGRAVGRPRVPGRANVGVDDAVGEFEQVGFAHQHGPGRGEAVDEGGVARGHVVGQDAAAAGRTHAGGVDQVLERDGNAVEQAAIQAPTQFIGGAPGGGARLVGGDGDKGVEHGVERLDLGEGQLGHGHGRERPTAVACRHLGDGGKEDVFSRHGRCLPLLAVGTANGAHGGPAAGSVARFRAARRASASSRPCTKGTRAAARAGANCTPLQAARCCTAAASTGMSSGPGTRLLSLIGVPSVRPGWLPAGGGGRPRWRGSGRSRRR